jgi:hypothetical protein
MRDDLRTPEERVIPKVCGADIELSNCELTADQPGGTGFEASRRLLAQIDGFPERQRGLFDDSWPKASAAHYTDNEYGATCPAAEASAYNPQDVSRRFLAGNSSSCYIDLDHLEICTPEVRSAHDSVAACHAMLRVARAALKQANALRPQRRIRVLANNSDGLGNSYGSHVSFLISAHAYANILHRKPHYMQFLASFQIASIVLTGQGKVGAENGRPAVPYQISQRADFFEIMQGLQTTFNRPIVNSRDEALCGPWSAGDWSTPARLHVIFFDNSLAHGSMLFRTGLMQLMLTLIELECVNPRLILDNPLKALLDYSHDATLQAAAPLIGGEEVTAVELQCAYLEEVKRHAAQGVFDGVVPRAGEIIALWEDTLNKLINRDLTSLAPRLDWIQKLMAIERAMDAHPTLDWNSPETKLIDHLYSSLDDDGVYFAYEASGFSERLVSDEEIEYFLNNPPVDTRAWTRAMLLRRAAAEGIGIDTVDWDRITFRMRGRSGWPVYRTVYLSDPLGFTQAAAGPLFAAAANFDQLLDGLESLAADGAGATGLNTIHGTQKGTHHAFS